jgi:hypothetical protein
MNTLPLYAWLNRLANTRTLLKTAVRGGVLRVTGSELVYGEGVVGSRNQRRLPLRELATLTVHAPQAGVFTVAVTIHAASGPWLTLEGFSPTAAQRLARIVAVLRPI